MAKRNFQYTNYTPATDEEIAAFAKKYNINFCDDFIEFLKTDNGLEIQEDYDFEAIEEWLNEVTTFVGIGQDQPYPMTSEIDGFFDPRFLPICYPVGTDGGGNLMVQISAGHRRGQLAMLDHEVFHGGMDALLEVEDGCYPDDEDIPLPFQTFAEATPDQVLDECFKQGFLADYEVTFAEQMKWITRFYNKQAKINKTKPPAVIETKAKIYQAYFARYVQEKYTPLEKMSDFYGDYTIFRPGEFISWHYKVTMADTQDINVRSTIKRDGVLMSNAAYAIESNGIFARHFSIPEDTPPNAIHSYEVEFEFPDNPELPTLTDKQWGMVSDPELNFTRWAFRPADEKEISALEDKLPYQFCGDFRGWLKGENGISILWWSARLWDGLSKDIQERFEEDRKTNATKEPWLEISSLHGLNPPTKFWNKHMDPPSWNNLERGLTSEFRLEYVEEISQPHLKFIYPVARTSASGSDGFYQIARGKHRGKVAELLKYSFLLDQLAEVQNYQRTEGHGKKTKILKYEFENFESATPDQIIEAWINDGAMRLLDLDFCTFKDRVVALNETEFDRLYEKYLERN